MQSANSPNRRNFLSVSMAASVAYCASSKALRGATMAPVAGFSTKPAGRRKFTMDLCPGRIGVSTNQTETIEMAAKSGFESVEPNGEFLARLTADQLAEVKTSLSRQKLVWGAAGLPVDFRRDNAKFDDDLAKLPKIAEALHRAGATRIGTWISPAHDELTYLKNFRQHATRLRAVAQVLGDSGLRLGLEYVGPRTLWASKRYAFVHTLAETKELLAEIGASNVGVVLDSWHWYTAEENVSDLLSLKADEIVAVDLNDAPAGVDVRDQIDNRRELPSATGVIDVRAFLTALVTIGYDGPVRAEPFNQPLNAMEDAAAVEATASAMKKAFALIEA